MSRRSGREQLQPQRQRGRRTSSSSTGGGGSLNQRMRSARSAAELLDLLGDQDISSLSLIDASTAVHVLARQRPVSSGNAKHGTTTAALMRHVEDHTVPKLTNDRTILTLLWAVAKLQDSTDNSLQSSALECLSRKGLQLLGTCDGRGVATVAWSVVQLRKTTPSLAEDDVTFAIERGITRLLCESDHAQAVDAHSLATIAWACGALRCRDRALLHKLGDHALSRLGEFTTQGLQNIVTTLAKCGYSAHGELLKGLKASFLQRVSEFDAQGLSAFSWAFQKLQPGQNVDLVLASAQALCATADQRKGGVGAAAESVTQSLLAVATLLAAPNTRPRRLYAKFRPVVLELLLRCEQAQCDISFDMPQISTTISSFAKLVGCVGLFEETAEWCTRRAQLTEKLKNGLLRVLQQSQAQDLAIVLWGLGRLHGCSKKRERAAKGTLFAPVEAVQVLQSVHRQLLSFNWRSMGLMDYAIPQLLTGSLADSTTTSRHTFEEWERLRQEVEAQRRKRACALMTALHCASDTVGKQPWSLAQDALSGRCTQRSVNLLAALLAPRVSANAPQRMASKCRVLLFDDNTGEVGSTVRLLAAKHTSIEVELSGCMRYASASNRFEYSAGTGPRNAVATEKIDSEVRWNMPWTEWEQQMRVEDDMATQQRDSDQHGSTRFDCCLMRYPGTFGRDSSESFAMALAAVACRLPVGAPLLLCGLLEETVTTGVGGGGVADTARLQPGSATEPKLPSSLRNCLNKWFTAASIIEHRHGIDTCGGAVLVRAARNSSCCPVESGRIAAWATDTTHPLQSHTGIGIAKDGGWRTFPGLFSGGTLSEMTQSLLDHIPTPPSGASVLDFACGSGIIGAALLQKQPSIALHMLDADSVAIEAVRRNVSSAYAVHLSDGWASVDPSLRFDFIVSNPPVHSGLGDDMEVVKGLVQGAAPRALGGGGRLKPGGILCLVTQTQIPTGCILHANGFEESQRNFVDCEAGHFLVWTATVGQTAAFRGGDAQHAQRVAKLRQHCTQSTEIQACKEDEKLNQSRKHSAKKRHARTGQDHHDLALTVPQKQVVQNYDSESQLQQLLHRGDVTELTAAKLAAASAEDYERAALLKRHIAALQENGQAVTTAVVDTATAPKLARKRKRKEKQKRRKRADVGP